MEFVLKVVEVVLRGRASRLCFEVVLEVVLEEVARHGKGG